MTALLGIGSADAEQLCAEVRGDGVLVVANENSPSRSSRAARSPRSSGSRRSPSSARSGTVRLGVAGAFHSELMRPALPAVSEALDADRDPGSPDGDRGERHRRARHGRRTPAELLPMQLISPVRWDTGIRSLAEAGATTFIEAGPGEVLTKLMKRIDPSVRAVAVGSPDAGLSAVAAS